MNHNKGYEAFHGLITRNEIVTTMEDLFYSIKFIFEHITLKLIKKGHVSYRRIYLLQLS
jgi:hypothetical protein